MNLSDVRSVIRKFRDSVTAESDARFSLTRLQRVNPALAQVFMWEENPWLTEDTVSQPINLQIGCGERVLDEFVNVDFIPCDPRVLKWNLLDLWSTKLVNRVNIAFSEDVLEHFFYPEQLYILCSMNRVLQDKGVFRVLMPDLERLIGCSLNFSAQNNDDWFVKMGIETGMDALNFGMRMSGHSWLHNQHSLTQMAHLCGFEAISTSCYHSTVQQMNGLNLRNEDNSLSFANDLVKTRTMQSWLVSPTSVKNATLVEKVASDCALYRAKTSDPQIEYQLPTALNCHQVVLLNFRSANLSEFNEHNFAKVYLKPKEEYTISLDSSLGSTASSNLFSANQIRLKTEANDSIRTLRFDPSETKGALFTVGPLEVFFIS